MTVTALSPRDPVFAMNNGRIDLLDHGFVRLVDSMGSRSCVLPVSLTMQRGELIE
jgi:hypothetical protein